MKPSLKILIFIAFLCVYTILLLATVRIVYEKIYEGKIYPQVYINKVNATGWTKKETEEYLREINRTNTPTSHASTISFILNFEGREWATDTNKLKLQYDAKKMADTAYEAGRKIHGLVPNLEEKINLFLYPAHINPSYMIDEEALNNFINEIKKDINIEPEDALFNFDGVRVSAFKFGKDGRKVDEENIKKTIFDAVSTMGTASKNRLYKINISTLVVKPRIGNESAHNLGINELIGRGVSYFYDSIPSRVYNLTLAASKFHGVLIKPNGTFSFLKTVGSITKLDGYKEAYVIKGGKTVLGDGGGVCQVSTTAYRAALYAGLPIVERVPHSYRVGYYEPPVGFDATIYQPGGPDLRFKNDTGNYILIQTFVDEQNMSLTFDFYGTSDGRVIQISDPVVVSTSPSPATKYQDDPALPVGTEKQIDTAHAGAKVYFTRRVVRGNDILINEKVWSSYIPWAAVVLRGTR
jgi:vancomycin resistance protein YoaR